MNSDVTVEATALRDFAIAVLVELEMSLEDARRAAAAMVWGDLRGLPAHGVGGKLPQCVARIEGRGTTATPDMKIIRDSGSLLVMAGGRAWGQVAATRAMELAIERARTTGMAAVSVNDVSSAGAMGFYASLAADAGMIGMAITNGSSIMAPWGGSARVLGNQGHSIGCPTASGPPVVYDSALTLMSTGEIDSFHEAGRRLPEGVLLDADGEPTTDPGAWFDGVLAPVGGHRGYGLALMFEILTGVLSGGERFAPELVHPSEVGVPQGVSLFLLALDPGVVMGSGDFLERVGLLIQRVHDSRLAPGVDRIWYPGERSGELAEEHARSGIPLSGPAFEALGDLGARLGVAPPPPR